MREWWDRKDPEWRLSRAKALDLMKREQRLEQIVRLIGPDALPDDQRLILVAAEMIKNGFLQQSAFDEIDMYCVPEKQVLHPPRDHGFLPHGPRGHPAGRAADRHRADACEAAPRAAKSEVPNDGLEEIRAVGARQRGGLRRAGARVRAREEAR